MTTLEIIIRFLEAAALGALVGLEREVIASHRKSRDPLRKFAVFGGLRSYILMALTGSLSVYLGEMLGSPQDMIIFVGSIVFVFITLSYIYSAFKYDFFGVTSELAAVITFLLGTLVMLGELQVAVFIGVGLTFILTYKSHISLIVDQIKGAEITNTLKFAVIALVILPLLPDQSYSIHDFFRFIPEGKFVLVQFLNPHMIWQFVVIISGVSYLGYILGKIYGAKNGILVSGVIGGIGSSTAATSAMAEISRSDNDNFYPTVIATITACTIMLFRIILIVIIFNPNLLSILLIPILAMVFASALVLLWLWKKSSTHDIAVTGQKPESPFRIIPALKFAGLIVIIKFFSALAITYQDSIAQFIGGESFKNIPVYVISLLSGLADVDVITQDMAEKSMTGSHPLPAIVATIAIIIGLIANTGIKISIAKRFGSPLFGTYVFRILGLVLFVGILALFIVTLFV